MIAYNAGRSLFYAAVPAFFYLVQCVVSHFKLVQNGIVQNKGLQPIVL